MKSRSYLSQLLCLGCCLLAAKAQAQLPRTQGDTALLQQQPQGTNNAPDVIRPTRSSEALPEKETRRNKQLQKKDNKENDAKADPSPRHEHRFSRELEDNEQKADDPHAGERPQALELIHCEWLPTQAKQSYSLWEQLFMPPMHTWRVRITLQNRHDHPRWYVFPVLASSQLPSDGRFVALPKDGNAPSMEWAAMSAGQAGDSIVRFSFSGVFDPQKPSVSQDFYAFCLPAQGQLVLEQHELQSVARVDTLHCWSVRQLLVDGQTNLEQWWPQPRWSCPVQGHLLQGLWSEARRSHPHLPAQYLQAEDIRNYRILLRRTTSQY